MVHSYPPAYRKAIYGLGAVCIVAVVAAVVAYVLAGRATRSLELARAKVSAAEARLRDLKAAGRDELRAVIRLQNAADELEKESAQPRADVAASAAAQEGGEKFLAAYPENRALLDQVLKQRAYATVGAALRAVGCSEAEIEQAVQLRLRMKGMSLGVVVDGISLPAAGDLSSTEVEERIKALIGDAKYATYREYARDDLSRYLAIRVADVASWSGSPLTHQQVDSLRQVFGRHRQTWDFDAMLQESGSALSQEQVAALRKVMEFQKSVVESNRYGQALFNAEYGKSP
jgi:hypothetical protein